MLVDEAHSVVDISLSLEHTDSASRVFEAVSLTIASGNELVQIGDFLSGRTTVTGEVREKLSQILCSA